MQEILREKRGKFFISNFTKKFFQKPKKFFFFGSLIFFALFFLLFFHGILFENRQFAYRDAAYFYYPLCRQIQNRIEAGEIPLWDPYENLGHPLLANPTSMVFYPGRLVFFLPKILPVSYDFCFKVFVLAHIVLAFVGFQLLSSLVWRKKRLISYKGGLFASFAWIWGGYVLFQTSNIVFLIGAAWFPLLFFFGFQLIRFSGWKNIVGVSVVFVMMITGGDPQTAYMGGILLLTFSCFYRGEKESCLEHKQGIQRYFLCHRRGWQGIFCSFLLAALLAAVQILPAIELTRLTNRSEKSVFKTLYETSFNFLNKEEKVPTDSENNWRGRHIEKGGGERAVYQFSVPPWRWAEWIAPNIGGREYLQNTRWFSSLPNDSALWTPSLYMGLYPILFACWGAVFFRSSRRKTEDDVEGVSNDLTFRRLWTWITLIAILASLGGFGFGWFYRFFMDGGENSLSFQREDPVGGVYWLLRLILPGFASFRYPAKMMMIASFGLALLAGIGWDSFWERGTVQERKRFGRGILILAVISWGSVLWGMFRQPWRDLGNLLGTHFRPSVSLYGPFQEELARRNFQLACLQTAVLAFLLYLGVKWIVDEQGKMSKDFSPQKGIYRYLIQSFLIIVLGVDLYLANGWLIAETPDTVFHRQSPIGKIIQTTQDESLFPRRIFRDPLFFPPSFFKESSSQRLTERVLWDRATLFQKDSIEAGIANVDVRGTFDLSEFYQFSSFLRAYWRQAKQSGNVSPSLEKMLALIDIDYVLGPPRVKWETESAEQISLNVSSTQFSQNKKNLTLERLKRSKGRIRILHQSPTSIPTWQTLLKAEDNSQTFLDEEAKIIDYKPERIEFITALREKGTVLLAEQYFPGWEAEVFPLNETSKSEIDLDKISPEKNGDSYEVPIQKVGSFFRGIELEAGRYRVVMTYKPRSFQIGALISLLAWGGLALGIIVPQVKKRFRQYRAPFRKR